MNCPKISIVTPNYNGGAFLEATILSVLSQEYPNIEYIIIDGGSIDNSIDIIKKYQSQLAYWVSEPDKGLYDAVQKGFEKSTGEIMAWINSDDLYHNKSFFTVAEIFNKITEVNWLLGNPSFFDEQGRIVAIDKLKRWSKLDFYLGNYQWIQQESVFWRRALWEKAGSHLNVEMKFAGDLELWLRFFRFEKLYVTTALLGGFRQHSKGQLSVNFLAEYIYEANNVIQLERQNKISEIENNWLKNLEKHYRLKRKLQFKFIERIISKLYFSRRIKVITNNFSYSPIVKFDRTTQSFRI